MTMLTRFHLSPEMIPYLLYQRTQYILPIHNRIKRYLRFAKLSGVYANTVEKGIDRLRKDNLAQLYFDEILEIYRNISKSLPSQSTNILDIGCGIGGINAFIYQHYKNKPNIHLLDKDGIGEIFYGFEKEASHYNNLNLSKKFLVDNGLSEKKITTYDISKVEFPNNIEFDLVISLISWGFHYPLDTYLTNVSDMLTSGGVLILDLRKNSNDLNLLDSSYTDIEIVDEDYKRIRVAGRRL